MDIWGGISGTIYIFDQRYFNILWGLTSTDAYFRRGKFGFCSAFVLAPLYNVRKINGARPFSSHQLLGTKTYFVQSLLYFLHHIESKTPHIENISLKELKALHSAPSSQLKLMVKTLPQNTKSVSYILGNLPKFSVHNLLLNITMCLGSLEHRQQPQNPFV